MAKPSSKPDWTEGNPDAGTITVEPTAGKKLAGFLLDERPTRQLLNWLFFNITEWITYFETLTDGLANQLGQYDAVIGFGGTHASINALMLDAGIADLKNVLVTDSILVDTIQVINQPGMNFTFKPQTSFTQGAATTGLRIDAERVRIKGARFLNFTTKAIDMTANAKNCMIIESYFKNNTVMIDDALGTNNLLANNIEEV